MLYSVGSFYFFYRNKFLHPLTDEVSDWCTTLLPSHKPYEFQIVPMQCVEYRSAVSVEPDRFSKVIGPETDLSEYEEPIFRSTNGDMFVLPYDDVNIVPLSCTDDAEEVNIVHPEASGFKLLSIFVGDINRHIRLSGLHITDPSLKPLVRLKQDIQKVLVERFETMLVEIPLVIEGGSDITRCEFLNMVRHGGRVFIEATDHKDFTQFTMEHPELADTINDIFTDEGEDCFHGDSISRGALSETAKQKFDGIMHQLNGEMAEAYGDFEFKTYNILRRAKGRLRKLCREDSYKQARDKGL